MLSIRIPMEIRLYKCVDSGNLKNELIKKAEILIFFIKIKNGIFFNQKFFIRSDSQVFLKK